MTENLEEKSNKEEDNYGGGCLFLLLAGLGVFGVMAYSSHSLESKRIEAEKEIRIQELRTIEELTKEYGGKMSPEEFKDYVKNLNIGYKE